MRKRRNNLGSYGMGEGESFKFKVKEKAGDRVFYAVWKVGHFLKSCWGQKEDNIFIWKLNYLSLQNISLLNMDDKNNKVLIHIIFSSFIPKVSIVARLETSTHWHCHQTRIIFKKYFWNSAFMRSDWLVRSFLATCRWLDWAWRVLQAGPWQCGRNSRSGCWDLPPQGESTS